MKMQKQFLTTLIFISLLSSTLRAEEQEKHEFTLGGVLGLTSMKLDINSLKPTAGVDVGYNFFFNDVIGIGTGLGWSHYQWCTTMDEFSDRYVSHDGEEPFEFRSSFSGYTETQNASCLIVPLALRIQYHLFSDEQLTYFSIGGKAGLPLKSRYQTSGTTVTTSGYYSAYDVLLESPKSRGLGTFETEKQTSNLNIKNFWMLSAEAGMKWDILDQFSLYTGLYVDYSLNSINRKSGKPFLIYNADNPTQMNFNSVLHSHLKHIVLRSDLKQFVKNGVYLFSM